MPCVLTNGLSAKFHFLDICDLVHLILPSYPSSLNLNAYLFSPLKNSNAIVRNIDVRLDPGNATHICIQLVILVEDV